MVTLFVYVALAFGLVLKCRNQLVIVVWRVVVVVVEVMINKNKLIMAKFVSETLKLVQVGEFVQFMGAIIMIAV